MIMSIWTRVTTWLKNLYMSPEDQFLMMSTDLADFERRQRRLEYASRNGINNYKCM